MPVALKIILIINMASVLGGSVAAIAIPMSRHLSSEIGAPSPLQMEHRRMSGTEIRRRILVALGSFLAVPVLCRLFIPVLPGLAMYLWLGNAFAAGHAILYRVTHSRSH